MIANIQPFNKIAPHLKSQYEYKADYMPNAFQTTFMDTVSNKKVRLYIDENITSDLYKNFKNDMNIEDTQLEVKGDLKSYLETMWAKFKYERNFNDSNGDGFFDTKEFFEAKAGVNLETLSNSTKDDSVKWESINDTDPNSKDLEKYFTKEIRENKNFYTPNAFFLGYINQDKNFDTKVTNSEMIENINKDPLGKTLLAEAGGAKLYLQGSILRAILEGIKKKQIIF